jgi:hypothetical protein
MSKTIYPVIFYSIGNFGKELFDSIRKDAKEINNTVYSRFIRYTIFGEDYTIINSINDDKIQLPFTASKSKAENYAKVNRIRTEYKAVFEKLLNDIFVFENINYATENDLTLGKPQIVVLTSIDTPELSPLIIPLLQILESLPQSPEIHLIILYNQKLHSENEAKTAILKNSFLREIDSLKLVRPPHVWLIDIINEKEINLKDSKTLFYSVGKFTDLLLTEASRIGSSIYTGVELGKPCIYSTFGYSLLTFPINRISEYLGIYSCEKEIKNLVSEFDVKYEVIALKDELNKFFIISGFESIPEKLAKKDNTEAIYSPFKFNERTFTDLENEYALGKKLSPVDEPLTLSKTTSNDFFNKIEDYEKSYSDSTLMEFSQLLDKAKKRELQLAIDVIADTQCSLMDQKGRGINYSHLFVAMLANNKGAVENMLEGRFTSDIHTLTNLQDKFRSRFIGDQVVESEKKLRDESDNYANKCKLIDQYSNQIKNSELSLKRFEESVGSDSPKYTELNSQIVSLKDQIKLLTSENELHKRNIADLTYQIEQVKLDFDHDATKENFKEKRNKKAKDEIIEIKDKKIEELDKQLAPKYEEKNIKIKERNKFIFINLLLIPIAILAVLILTQVILLYKTDWFDIKWFLRGLVVTGITELIYYIFNFIKFIKLMKQFNLLLDEIKSLLSDKRNLLARYVILKNDCYHNDFCFEKDLIALSMVDSIAKSTSLRQSKMEEFKAFIQLESNKLDEKVNSFSLNESSFEFCVIGRNEIEAIYNNSVHESVMIRNDDFRLSKCFEDFILTGDLHTFYNPILDDAMEVHERKIKGETLKSILFNESSTFEKKVNTKAKFQQVIETSRPLLKTGFWPNLSNDTAYTENIVVGFNHTSYKEYLKEIKLANLSIDEANAYIFGVLSIKSNFPSFLIYDVEINEGILRKGITKENQSQYFINDNSYNYSLIPSITKTDKDERGNLLLGNELILALTNKLIYFDSGKRKFIHDVIGDLGMELDDLINNWTTSICYEIFEEAGKRYEEIWHFDESEFKEYSTQFKEIWLNFPVKVPLKCENELSEYFFSIHGTETDWKEIKEALKGKSKKNTY